MGVDHCPHRAHACSHRVDDQIIDSALPQLNAVAWIGKHLAHDALGRLSHQWQEDCIFLASRHLRRGTRAAAAWTLHIWTLHIERDIQHKRQPEQWFENHPLDLGELKTPMQVSESESWRTQNLHHFTGSAVCWIDQGTGPLSARLCWHD